MSDKITTEMISAKIREIEEPLITADELSEVLKISKQTIHTMMKNIGIKPYTIMIDGYYHNAFDEEQIKKILAKRSERVAYTRKNILDISKLC